MRRPSLQGRTCSAPCTAHPPGPSEFNRTAHREGLSRWPKPSQRPCRIHQPVLARHARQRDVVVDPHLLEQPRLVRVHRLRAQAQAPRDVFLAQALGQQQRHFQLARRQAVERRAVALHRRQRQVLRDAGAQVATTGRHVAHRTQQLLRIAAISDVAGGTGFKQALRQRAVFQHRHDHYAGIAVAADNALGHFHATDTRQVQIAQHHVRQQLAHFTQRVFAGLGFAHHLDVGFPRQNHLHPGADQCVVIHQVDSNRHSRTSSNAAIAGQARQGAVTLQARS
ncbi:hypothetical protein G6F31_016239 [Rhizopus arrhizus]|nr:hypothetical protein G6F31_016239 [Rhizopus arrhizus]